MAIRTHDRRINHQFGTFLRTRRRELGLAQADVARRVGFSTSRYSQIEMGGGERLPAPPQLTAIAHVLEVPITDLFDAAGYGVPVEVS